MWVEVLSLCIQIFLVQHHSLIRMRILKYFQDPLDHWVQNMLSKILIKRIYLYFPLIFHGNNLEVLGRILNLSLEHLILKMYICDQRDSPYQNTSAKIYLDPYFGIERHLDYSQ